jgi:hypothetical protein
MNRIERLTADLRALRARHQAGLVDDATFERERRELLSHLQTAVPKPEVEPAEPRISEAESEADAAGTCVCGGAIPAGTRPRRVSRLGPVLGAAVVTAVAVALVVLGSRPKTVESRPAASMAAERQPVERQPGERRAAERPGPPPVEVVRRPPPARVGPQPSGGDEAAVRATVDRWIRTAIDRDLEAHMDCYAPSMSHYFKKDGVDIQLVRRDKESFFRKYDRLDLYAVSDVSIRTLGDGRADATFRKEWDAVTHAGVHYKGAERQRLELRQFGGRWKISSEVELEIYWTRRE